MINGGDGGGGNDDDMMVTINGFQHTPVFVFAICSNPTKPSQSPAVGSNVVA